MTPPLRRRPTDRLDHEPVAVEYARRNAGLTHRQLAAMCGVSKSLITEIENGTRNATPAMLNKLASALNCPRVILERKRYESEATTASTGDLPEPEVRGHERANQPVLPKVLRASVTGGNQ